ncbi:MAG: response regulator [Leptospiraceae bacterium]|nr:response regulator [Leptospiraceae bacterium]MCP5496677.1 response regulator [Leptospiraceae bacterium]
MKKILIVDDQAPMAKILGDILKKGNFEIHFAVNGQLGINKAIELKPDLIMMDIMMPVKTGIEAIKELKDMSEFQNTPMYLVSGKGGTRDVNLVKELGINGFIAKPFTPSIILEEIIKVLA